MLTPIVYIPILRLCAGRGVEVLLWRLTGRDVYRSSFEDYMSWWFQLPKLEHGLTFLSEWGSLRFAANMAFLALVGADYGIKPDEYRRFGKEQVGGASPMIALGLASRVWVENIQCHSEA